MYAKISIVSLLMVGACNEGDAIEVFCDRAHLGSEVDGVWMLEATGERTDCSEVRYEGDLDISSQVPIRIDSTEIEPDAGVPASPADAFVDRIVRRSTFSLDADTAPENFMFNGETEGSCVAFEMIEDLGRGDQLHYVFEGEIGAAGRIEGNFTGDGPKSCEVSGTFTVEVAR